MIDSKKILQSARILLDVLENNGYYRGKIEIDFDLYAKSVKVQIHQYKIIENEKIRNTKTIT